MTKRYEIQVRRYKNGTTQYSVVPEFEVVETIKRTIRVEQVGNFSPFFCRYKNNPRVLVSSDAGSLSDPFRRTDSYSESFFILEQGEAV